MNKTILISTSLLTILILAACGGNAPQPPPATDPVTEALPQPTAIPATETAVPVVVEATEETAPVEAPTEAASPASVSYAANVKPIFDAYCIECHGVESKKEGLDMLTYENLIAGSRHGPVLVPGDANNSLLVQLIVEGEMPNRGPALTPEEMQVIIDWINQGALNN